MAQQEQIYGEVNSKSGLEDVFLKIRKDVDEAKSRAGLTELYRRAGYLITLTHAPSWEDKFGKEASAMRRTAQDEFATTARSINRKAREIGTQDDYDETWGK